MSKQLKKWNGRASGRMKGHFYVAAHSQKQAAELIHKAGGNMGGSSIWEIRNYYSNCWGNAMNGIEPIEPCVYHQVHYETPNRIL